MTDPASTLSERELADLAALADGTLPPERREAVEAWVAGSPELQELLDRQRRAVAATQALAEEPTPESLRAAIEARRGRLGSRSGRARRLTPRLALAGAVAVVVAVVAALLSGGPGAPTVAEAARVAERAPSGQAPAAVGDGAQLDLDVEGVVFPDLLESYGWEAVGMRRDEIDGRNATTVFYENGGRRIAYVIVSGSGLPRPSGAPSTTRDGVLFHTLRVDGRLAVASWRGDGTLRY
jgi:hypothetical protein